MTTKKAKRAQKYIALAIAFMLAITALISWANSSTTISIDNSKVWDARESQENVADNSAMSTDEDGAVVATKEGAFSQPSLDVVKMIEEKFPENPKVVTAVFKAESGLNPKSMNWNCYYNGRSKSCLPQDRNKAWSVDCGLAQINRIGKDCPKELFDIENNLAEARKKFDTKQGLNHWYAFKDKLHLKFL